MALTDTDIALIRDEVGDTPDDTTLTWVQTGANDVGARTAYPAIAWAL